MELVRFLIFLASFMVKSFIYNILMPSIFYSKTNYITKKSVLMFGHLKPFWVGLTENA